MALRRLGLALLGFVVGGLVGGFAHMQLLFGAALDALERSGTNPWLFTTKPVGEEFFFRTYLYGVGILSGFLILMCFAIVKTIGAIARWRHGMLTRPTRPSLPAVAIPIAGASLGALCAAIANLRTVTRVYADQLASEEYFAVASTSAVPEMRTLTNAYVGITLALCIGATVAQVFQAMYRRA